MKAPDEITVNLTAEPDFVKWMERIEERVRELEAVAVTKEDVAALIEQEQRKAARQAGRGLGR